VQVVDLDRVGVSPVDGARFRLLMTVSSHGTTSYLSGDQTHIYALGFAGWKPNEKAIWEQGEMHLGAFFFKTETDHVTYDIVVTAGDVPRSR
ncbi:MAG TPA: hypothetical protein VGE52_14085, partial [Pirellulales bacterium]